MPEPHELVEKYKGITREELAKKVPLINFDEPPDSLKPKPFSCKQIREYVDPQMFGSKYSIIAKKVRKYAKSWKSKEQIRLVKHGAKSQIILSQNKHEQA